MNEKLFLVITGLCAFIVAFSLGTLLTATTGIPLAGGILNGIAVSMILTFGMLKSSEKYRGTLIWLVFSIPAIITTTLGPPGIYKILIGVIAGFAWDTIYRALNYSRKGLYIGAVVGGILITISLLAILHLMISSGFDILGEIETYKASLERLKSYISIIFFINIIVTCIGVYIGERIYNRYGNSIELTK